MASNARLATKRFSASRLTTRLGCTTLHASLYCLDTALSSIRSPMDTCFHFAPSHSTSCRPASKARTFFFLPYSSDQLVSIGSSLSLNESSSAFSASCFALRFSSSSTASDCFAFSAHHRSVCPANTAAAAAAAPPLADASAPAAVAAVLVGSTIFKPTCPVPTAFTEASLPDFSRKRSSTGSHSSLPFLTCSARMRSYRAFTLAA
mmetsp:Transcript_70222/g.141433  ORF Transcript_70222/g.141433 Transcript_70222/m.141433 type:complete len:206 (+) Transcript_70222:284-901(+)